MKLRLACIVVVALGLALSGSAPARAQVADPGRLDHTLFEDGVRVHYAAGAEGLARETARFVAEQRGLVQARLGVDVLSPLEVRVARTRVAYEEAVRSLVGESPPEWSLAVAITGLGQGGVIVIHAGGLRPLTDHALEPVVAHELAHLALARAGPELPRWLNEGLAMWAAGERIGPDERSLLVRSARSGALHDFDELEARFPPHTPKAQLAYVQSLAAVHLIVRQHGADRVRTLLRALAAGERFEPAFRLVFGVPPESVERALADELESPLAVWQPFFQELTSNAGVLSVAAFLAILAFWRYRGRRRRLLRAMAEEEDRARKKAEAARAAARHWPGRGPYASDP